MVVTMKARSIDMEPASPLSTSSLPSNLPPEILLNICSLNARPSDPWHCFAPSNLDYIRDTISASQVCHSWRTILLSAPELWMHMVDPYKRFWSELVMERSIPHGITFSLPVRKQAEQRSKEDLETEMSDIYRMRLLRYQFNIETEGPRDRVLALARECLKPRTFPMLESLSIVFLGQGAQITLKKDFPTADKMPNLKRLYLRRCFFPDMEQFTAIGRNLTHLYFQSSWLTVDALSEHLQRVQRLQSLTLDHAFVEVHYNGGEAGLKKLHLGELQEISVNDLDYASHAIALLSCISHPPLSIFKFSLHFSIVDLPNLPTSSYLLPYLGSALCNMNVPKLPCSLELYCREGLTYEIHPNTVSGGSQDPPRSAVFSNVQSFPRSCTIQFSPYLKPGWTGLRPWEESLFRMNPDGEGTLWQTITKELHSKLGLFGAYDQVRHLVISSYTKDISDGVMLQVLRQCRKVVSLREVDILLWEFLSETSKSEDAGSLLPSLEEITFTTFNMIILDDSDSHIIHSGLCDYDSADDADERENLTNELWVSGSEDGNWDEYWKWHREIYLPAEEAGDNEGDDPTFVYKDGDSDNGHENEPEEFYLEDLKTFCLQHKSLRRLKFLSIPDDDNILIELRLQLGSFEVEVEGSGRL